MVEKSVKASADVNKKDKDGLTALMSASLYYNKEEVEKLIKAGANVNEKNNNGKTALIYTIEKNHVEVAESLIKAGANVNEKDNNGKTALAYAIIKNKVKVIEELIKAGANVNEKDDNGQTALMIASMRNKVRVVEELIKAGANVNEKDNNGKTALTYAIIENKVEVVEKLIKVGANVDEKDKNGLTALMKVNSSNKIKVAEKLIEIDTNINEKDGLTAPAHVGIKEAKSMPELSLQLMKINEGMKMLEPVLSKEAFWRRALRNVIGNSAMTLEEIYNNKIFLFLNKIHYTEEINSVLNDDNCFKKVNLYGAYARVENKNYSKLKILSEEVGPFLSNLNTNQQIVFQRRILKNDTFERVAREIWVTRERVRQIEIKIREKLNVCKIQLTFKPYFQYVIDFFEKQKERVFNLEEFNYYISLKNQHFGELNFDLIDFFNATNNLDKKINKLFDKYLSILTLEEIDKIFSKIFENQNFMNEDDFYLIIRKHLISNKAFIDDYIVNNSNMKKIDRIVMYKNSKITTRDKIELIFKIEDTTLKIVELVNLYKKYFGVELTEESIKRRLLENPDKFRRIFKETYSLLEWEIKNYIKVKKLVVECLREAKKPLHYSEIATYVKQKTGANEKVFKYNNGYTALKEWEDDGNLCKTYSLSEWGVENHIRAKDLIVEGLRAAKKHKQIYKQSNINLIAECLKEAKKHDHIYENLEISLIVECLREARKPMHYLEIVDYIKQKTKASKYIIKTFTGKIPHYGYWHCTVEKGWNDDERLSGKYSLSEWEIENHIIIKDLIVECLREAKKPLHYLEIAAYVKQKTEVNENTIKIFKANEQTFKYNYHGYTALKEWEEFEGVSQI